VNHTWNTINEALDDAQNGDIIKVYNGTYPENLDVDVSVELVGQMTDLFGNDPNGAIIVGMSGMDVVRITTNGVRISKLSMQGGGSNYAGIRIESNLNFVSENTVLINGYGIICSGNNDISENIIVGNFYDGVFLDFFESGTFVGNNITGNGGNGVKLRSSDRNIISDNEIMYNQDHGISLEESSNNIISQNRIFLNGDSGIELYHSSNHNEVYDNPIISHNGENGVKLWWGSQDNSFTGNNIMNNTHDGIYIDHSNSIIEANIHVENNIILNNEGHGVYILHSRGDTISGNNITSNGNDGIYLDCSNYTIISGNIIMNNDEGIYQSSSKGNKISSNTIKNNTRGIYLSSSTGNKISWNTISMNDLGIYLHSQSDGNTISKNYICNNTAYGVKFYYSKENIIDHNSITDNNNTGVFIEIHSNDNKIYHNNFINNTNQAHDECDNTWDDGYPSGGNYWSDFDETSEGAYDNNSDDIVDTPYNISGGNNQDRYPLIFLVNIENSPPSKPAKPSGEASGKYGSEYIYESSTTDADEDQVYYLWDWGDGTYSDWLGPYNPEQTASASHNWSKRGSYSIKVKARDTNQAESEWSDPLPITMPKNKAINLFLLFLERLIERFPILERVLQLIYVYLG